MYKRLPELAVSIPNARLLAVTIDGKPFAARDGMKIERQQGARVVSLAPESAVPEAMQ